MKQVYSDKIFDWVLLSVIVLSFVDQFFMLPSEFETFGILALRIVLGIITTLALLSFFVKKMNTEFYSRLFIVGKIIVPVLAVYYRFIVDQIIYWVTRTDLILNPVLHINFLIGLVLYFFSVRFSRKTKMQRDIEYGFMIMLYGLFLIILNCTCFFDYEESEFSVFEFLIKFLLGILIIFVGNKVRLENIKLKKAFIMMMIMAVIYLML